MNNGTANLADDYPASPATTGSVAVGGTATGTLERGDDQDWFRIELTADHVYRLDLLGQYNGDGTLRDPYLYLRDDAGTLVAANDDGGAGLNSRLLFRAPDDGTWYIDVGSFADGSTGTYAIRLSDRTGLDLVGTQDADRLVGGERMDTISGLGGADTLLGGADSDTLQGGSGNDLLDGGSGWDELIGGDGNDRYVVRTVSDLIVESAGGGRDTVIISGASYTLARDVEQLEMRGTLGLSGFGNSLSNVLLGNDGHNRLSGGGGNDLLDGRLGADTLAGGAGSDTFRFSAAPAGGGVDRLVDFSAVADRIALDDAVFGTIGPLGALASEAFRSGSAAADASDRILYDSATGRLFYDADGNGAAAAVHFANVTAGTALTAADLWVV